LKRPYLILYVVISVIEQALIIRYSTELATCTRYANRLYQQGVRAGQCVLTRTSGYELVQLQWALRLLDAALFPLAPQATSQQVQQLQAISHAEWIWFTTQRRGAQGRLYSFRQQPVDQVQHEPLALFVGTSGSTGTPKIVMLTRQQLEASTSRLNDILQLQAQDMWLSCLPRHYIGGLMIAERCAQSHAALVLHHRFDAAAIFHTLQHLPITHISLVPPLLARLIAQGQRPPSTLRVALIGGQALSRPLAQQALACGWPLYVSYGMTETASAIAVQRVTEDHFVPCSEQNDCHLGVMAVPDLEFSCPSCTTGIGQLSVRGPMIMAGYANPCRQFGQGLEAGWLLTSDLACCSQDRLLFIHGRADQLLTIAGIQVNPTTITHQLQSAPGVTDCFVVGCPDAIWGHRLVALYHGNCSVEALESWCRTHLSSAHRPRTIVHVATWPMLPSGKQDLTRLSTLALEAVAHQSA
jgi:O-succinylbenzoic acid--CoA ligase